MSSSLPVRIVLVVDTECGCSFHKKHDEEPKKPDEHKPDDKKADAAKNMK